jgi:flavin-dependent dehydrogenase
MAASTLHQALASDDLRARGLASYELRWRKRLGAELKKGYQIRRFYDGLSDRQIDKLFASIEASDMAGVLLKDGQVSFDWHGSGLLRILGSAAVSKVASSLKRPFRPKEKS